MRKVLFSLGAVSLFGAAFFVACSSSSGDDSTSTVDSGADVSTDQYVPPTDSGGPVDSGADAACQRCSDFIVNGPHPPECTDNGPPSSADLVTALFNDCTCAMDGGCFTACEALCTSLTAPDDTCQACVGTTCSAQLAACAADGADAGSSTDGGDGG